MSTLSPICPLLCFPGSPPPYLSLATLTTFYPTFLPSVAPCTSTIVILRPCCPAWFVWIERLPWPLGQLGDASLLGGYVAITPVWLVCTALCLAPALPESTGGRGNKAESGKVTGSSLS